MRLGIGGLDSCMAGEWLGGLGGDERWHTHRNPLVPAHLLVHSMKRRMEENERDWRRMPS